MNTSDRIEIPLSKVKLALLALGATLFVAAGIWIISLSGFYNVLSLLLGIVCVLFFGVVGIFIIGKLFSTEPGLTITPEGMHDNSSGISAGFIPWTDVIDIGQAQANSQRFLMIFVRNPEDYIQKQTNWVSKKMAQMNYNHYGSPVAFSANGLKCDYDELKELIDSKFMEFKRKNPDNS